jgi:hypothetical protein
MVAIEEATTHGDSETEMEGGQTGSDATGG